MSTITTRKDFNEPLGEVTSINGDEAHQLLHLMVVKSALQTYMTTGIKVSPMFSMKMVKQVTGLTTSNKQKHVEKLDAMIAEQRTKVTYVEETR